MEKSGLLLDSVGEKKLNHHLGHSTTIKWGVDKVCKAFKILIIASGDRVSRPMLTSLLAGENTGEGVVKISEFVVEN